MIAADAFRAIKPMIDHVERDLTVRGMTSLSLAAGFPAALEIGWPWIAGTACPDEELVLLTAATLLAGEGPVMDISGRFLRGRDRGGPMQVLASARLAWGSVTREGAVRLRNRRGQEVEEVRRSDLQMLERSLDPGLDVAMLLVALPEEAPLGLLVTPISAGQVQRLDDLEPVTPGQGLPAAWRASLERRRTLRALHGAASPPTLDEILATAEDPGEEREVLRGDVETALRAVLWSPVLAGDSASCGAYVLAAADGQVGSMLAGEVARVALAVLARRAQSAWRPTSAAHLGPWAWGADESRLLSAGLHELAVQAGWVAPGQRGAGGEQVARSGAPALERQRIARLAHARRLLPGDERPWWVDEAVQWRMERVLLDLFATEAQRAIPVTELAADGRERAAVVRVGRALVGDESAFLVRDLPVRLVTLLSLQGVGEGTLDLLRPFVGRALDEAMKPDEDANAVEAADRLSGGLDRLASLFSAGGAED